MKHTNFKHKFKETFTSIDRGSPEDSTGKRGKAFIRPAGIKLGDPRSVQTGCAAVGIGVEAGGKVGWP